MSGFLKSLRHSRIISENNWAYWWALTTLFSPWYHRKPRAVNGTNGLIIPLYSRVGAWLGAWSGTSVGNAVTPEDCNDALSIQASTLEPPQAVMIKPTGTSRTSSRIRPKK